MIFNFDSCPLTELVYTRMRQLSDHFYLRDIEELKRERGFLCLRVSIVIDHVSLSFLGFTDFSDMTLNLALVTIEFPGPTELLSRFLITVSFLFGSTMAT